MRVWAFSLSVLWASCLGAVNIQIIATEQSSGAYGGTLIIASSGKGVAFALPPHTAFGEVQYSSDKRLVAINFHEVSTQNSVIILLEKGGIVFPDYNIWGALGPLYVRAGLLPSANISRLNIGVTSIVGKTVHLRNHVIVSDVEKVFNFETSVGVALRGDHLEYTIQNNSGKK